MLQKKDCTTNTKRESKWEELFGHQPKEKDWSIIHRDNFRCTIETQLRSFYFKIFHNVIGVNAFLFKIRKRDSPNCYFCSEEPETLDHLFCNCTKVVPLWENLVDKIYTSSGISRDIVFTKFNYLLYIREVDTTLVLIPGGGGGTQMLFGRGCAAEASKPVPIFKGHFGGKGYPLLGVWRKRVPIIRDF